MRKLGIIFAIAAAATLGIAGTASAQAPEDVCAVPQTIADGAPENDPSDGGGEPVASSTQGIADSCRDSIEEQKLMPSPALCGIAAGLDARPGADLGQDIGSATVGAVNDGLAAEVDDQIPVVDFDACDTSTTPTTTPGDPPDKTNNNGGGTDPEVLANNATADGGLPRTGAPELLAGLGFGLTGIGALVRRFVG